MNKTIISKNQSKEVAKKLICIAVISLVFMTVEIIGGILAHSIAILADAFHLLTDVLAYIISLSAVLLSMKKAPQHLTFGYQKVQPLGALINVGLIWVVTFELLYESTQRIIAKQIVNQPLYMLLTSIFGLCCNLYIMRVLHSDSNSHQHCSHSHSHQSQNGRASLIQNVTKSPIKNKLSKRNKTKLRISENEVGEELHEKNLYESQLLDKNEQSRTTAQNKEQPFYNSNIQKQSINQNMHHHQTHSNCQGHHSHNHNHHDHDHQHHKHSNHKHNHSHQSHSNYINEKKIQKKHQFQNMNLEAAYVHILSDIILSIGVILSAVIIYFLAKKDQWTYWQLADPLCTYLFSIMALYSTISITKQSVIILLNGCPDSVMLRQILSELRDHGTIQQIRVWAVNRKQYYANLKMIPFENIELIDINQVFKKRNVNATIQLITSNYQ